HAAVHCYAVFHGGDPWLNPASRMAQGANPIKETKLKSLISFLFFRNTCESIHVSLTNCGLDLGTRFTSPRASISSLTVVTYHITEPSKFPLTSFSTARDNFIKVISLFSCKTQMIALRMISYFSLLIFTPCFFSG